MSDALQPVLVIGNKNYSSWSLRPWLFLRYFGVVFDEKMIWLDEPTMHVNMDKLDLASNHTVPVLIDGDFQVWDSLAIIEYTADKFALVDAWPLAIDARGLARAVSAEMHSSFMALRSAMPMNVRRQVADFQPDEAVLADIQRVQHLWRRCRQEFGQAIDEKVADPGWLFGHFSAADAMFAPVVMRFQTYGIMGDKICEAYCQKVRADPAMRRWIAAATLEDKVVAADEV